MANATNDPEYPLLSKGFLEAIALPSALCLQHESKYVPFASSELPSGCMDILVRVGLADCERQDAILRWAKEKGISTLQEMLTQLQDTESAMWEGLLEAIAPTKSYHKMRILTQLKRATGSVTEGGQESFRGAPGSLAYWTQLSPALPSARNRPSTISE